MQHGDRQAARSWAERAAVEAPDTEDPWLFLAALASPRASVAYLERALKINPQSERARKGMHWAANRLRKAQAEPTPPEQTQPHRITTAYSESTPQPQDIPTSISTSAPRAERLFPKSLAKYRWSFLTLILVAVCVTATWAFWPGNASPALAFLRAPAASIFGSPADIAKPTYTPSFSPTFTPTATFTPSPTFTATETPTNTPVPTDTPIPSNTPRPANTAKPLPTDTPIDYADNGGERWIDVNLSQQMLYAYEGDTIVNSFLVSTGVAQFPTVTGRYHIYIKLESTLMAGDGYYLPDVPYTMYFYKGYGIHGTYWHNNFGHPMSHGCVNMYTPDAEWMFYWASVGTLVNVHY